jgi:outer membrane protein assembly factor BamB
MRAALGIVLGCCVAAVAALASGDDWPQFRGPNGTATSAAAQLPTAWSAEQNVAWKAKLPGYGWSSPIVWGDKVFVTTAVTDKQRKPAGGFDGPEGFVGGGRGGRGGPGGGGGFRLPPPAQVLSSFMQEFLQLSAEQKKQMEELQKTVDGKLDKILTAEQKKQLKEPPDFRNRGPGRFPGFPQPGQVLSPSLQERLKLTADQKKQGEEMQKDVDTQLDKILTADQKKRLKDMREGFGRGGFGGFGRQRPPDAVYQFEVLCLDSATGKVLWKQVALEGKPHIPTQASNTYATETPVTDGERVYAYFGMHGVFCYDMTGKLVWKVDLGSYAMAMGYGTGSSPALDDGRLFIQCDNEEKSFLVALDAKTGKQLWRTARPEKTGFSTPLIWKNKVRTEVVCLGGSRARSYDPATGKQLWELGGMSGQPKASAVAAGDLLFVGTGGGPGGFGMRGGPGGGPPEGQPEGPREGGEGYGRGGSRPLFAVKAGASGDITLKDGAKSNAGVAWQLPKAGPQTASPVLIGDYLYVLEERGGLLSCYDTQTGKQVYKERLPGAKGFTSSPLVCDGKLLCLDDAGTTFIVQAGPTFKVLGKNSVPEMCWSSPAVASGALFLRTVDHLYCIKHKNGDK